MATVVFGTNWSSLGLSVWCLCSSPSCCRSWWRCWNCLSCRACHHWLCSGWCSSSHHPWWLRDMARARPKALVTSTPSHYEPRSLVLVTGRGRQSSHAPPQCNIQLDTLHVFTWSLPVTTSKPFPPLQASVAPPCSVGLLLLSPSLSPLLLPYPSTSQSCDNDMFTKEYLTFHILDWNGIWNGIHIC